MKGPHALLLLITCTPALAFEPLPKCPPSQSMDAVAKLRREIIYKEAHVSPELLKMLEEAAAADALACLSVVKAAHRLADENIRLISDCDK